MTAAGSGDPRGTPSAMGDLRIRAISALVLGPLVLAAAWIGGWPFAIVVCAASLVIVWEWNAVVRARAIDAALAVALAGVAIAIALVAGGQWWPAAGTLALAAVVAGFAAAGRGASFVYALPCAALPAAAVLVLRDDPEWGRLVVFWILLLVWATDIGAYFSGRALGGPKLWPAVSPKKTWAGALGGTAAAIVLSAIFAAYANVGVVVAVGLGLLLCVASQLGDLAESALKRRHGAKDSGALIPGHGGLMDRVDGLMAAALLAGIIGVARGGFDTPATGLLIW